MKFFLRLGLESHQFAVAVSLKDRQRHKQIRSVGNAPRRVRENKSGQDQR
jgi:hypothetical protein